MINAVYPVVWNMAGTFSSASHETDTRMRTDFKIVATHATIDYGGGGHGLVKVWMKNIGTTSIGRTEINQSDVFTGKDVDFTRVSYSLSWSPTPPPPIPLDDQWSYSFDDTNSNERWDPGETLEIDAMSTKLTPAGTTYNVYFQFVLPNGVWRSTVFTAS